MLKENQRRRDKEQVKNTVQTNRKICFVSRSLTTVPFLLHHRMQIIGLTCLALWVENVALTLPRLDFWKIGWSRWALMLHEYIHQMAHYGITTCHIQIKRHKQIKVLMSLTALLPSLITHLYFSQRCLRWGIEHLLQMVLQLYLVHEAPLWKNPNINEDSAESTNPPEWQAH